MATHVHHLKFSLASVTGRLEQPPGGAREPFQKGVSPAQRVAPRVLLLNTEPVELVSMDGAGRRDT